MMYNIAWGKQDLGTSLIMAGELVGPPMLRKCVLMGWAGRGETDAEKRHVLCHYCLEREIYTNGTLVAFFLTPPSCFFVVVVCMFFFLL